MHRLSKLVLPLYLLAVAIMATIAISRSDGATDNTGPPNEAISIQADDMGLSYFETTVRTTPVATDDLAYSTNPCSDDPVMNAALIALATSKVDGTQADETEVSAPLRGTRTGQIAVYLSTTSGRSQTDAWRGLSRMSNTGSKTVPAV